VLEGRPVYIAINSTDRDNNLEAVGFEPKRLNQLPLMFRFRAFHENRLPFTVRVKDADRKAAARMTLTSVGRAPGSESHETPIESRQTGSMDVYLPDWSGLGVAEVEADDVVLRKTAAVQNTSRPGGRGYKSRKSSNVVVFAWKWLKLKLIRTFSIRLIGRYI